MIDTINCANSWLTNNKLSISHYLINIILSGMIILIGITVAKIIPCWINNIMKKNNIDILITDFFSAIVKYSIAIFTIITVCGYLGIQTTSIITVIGAAGLAISLALQNSLTNLAAGILLVIFRYFRAGDYVDLNGITGTVIIVQIFATKIRTIDGKIIILPNNNILSNKIINLSEEPNRLININLSVESVTDIKLVKKLITDIFQSDRRILHDQGINVYLISLNKSSLNFMVRAWVSYNELHNTTFDLLEKVKRTFDQHKINIAYELITSIYLFFII